MRKLHLFSTLVALFLLATSSLWALPTGVVDGQLPGIFHVGCGEYVYFSQGNLQYNSTSNATQSPRWQFASEQYEHIGKATGNTNITADGKNNNTGIADLFGWVGNSSPWTDGLKLYGLTSSESSSDYGSTAGESLKDDWGNLAIWNGGNTANSGWRTLTQAQWEYLLNPYNSSDKRQGNRFAKATVHSKKGLIILPDGWTQEGSPTLLNINVTNATFDSNNINNKDWTTLENEGCVFLPVIDENGGEYRWRNSISGNVITCGYWSSTSRFNSSAYGLEVNDTRVDAKCEYGRNVGINVRLVKDVPSELVPAIPQASVATPPTAVTGLVYNGSVQTLVNAASGATGGGVRYKLGPSGSWEGNYGLMRAYNAGEYIVQWFVDASGCYVDSEVEEIHVTIARGTTSAPNPMPTIEAASLTYDGTEQDLVTATGDIQSGYTTVYSTDGVTWSTTIPQATNAGDYTVYYKFYKGDNYEYIPSPNTINASISKADIDLSGVTLPEATSTIPYDGTSKTLVEITPIPANCTVSYSTDGGNTWTTTPPTATAANDYSVQYKIVPDDAINYNTIGPNTVTVTIQDYPTITDHSDATTIAAALAENPTELKVQRTIYANGEYNTLCLPFALDESAISTSPLAGYERLKTFKGASVSGTGQDLYIDIFVEDATTIEAGKPYFISYPANHDDIDNPVFTGLSSFITEPGSISANGVTFQGMFAQVHIDPYAAEREQDYLFLGANSQLKWPLASETSDDVKMRGLRAYFIIDRTSHSAPAQAPRGSRVRLVDAPRIPTAIENTDVVTCTKTIENGQLVILKNGVKYNVQGQIIK